MHTVDRWDWTYVVHMNIDPSIGLMYTLWDGYDYSAYVSEGLAISNKIKSWKLSWKVVVL